MSKFKATVALLFLNMLQALADSYDKPLMMIYETDPNQLNRKADNFLFRQITELETRTALGGDSNILTVGMGKKWNGWGSKAKHISEELSEVHPERIVAVLDSRDVLLNNLDENSAKNLVEVFNKLTEKHENAIVVGAESQCCVSALTHANPGDFLNDDLTRTSTEACFSGQPGCLHKGKAYEQPWVSKIQHLAAQREVDSSTKNVYPNTGIIVGKAKNIRKIYDILNMKESEDDQALMTELMLKRPDLIVLDYNQELIGNNDWTEGLNGCVYEWSKDVSRFVHAKYKTMPAFLHFQGKFFECYGKMAKDFGYVGNMRRKLESRSLADSNYGPPSAGTSATFSGLVIAVVVAFAGQLSF